MNALSLSTINFSVSQMDNCADVTEAYLKNFGMLPNPGDIVLFQCLPMAVNTGQFFTLIKQQLSVTATYFDGMFLSFILPPSLNNIVFSIYLSKPINQSVNYTGTKVRYMGCFTTKSFLSLTDTPSSYAGAAGKVATVNALETALEFTTPGGGGLTCADLYACPKIISMDAVSTNLLMILIQSGVCSSKLIRYGSLYNFKTVIDPKGFAPLGCHIPSQAEWLLIQAAAGGATAAASYMKDTGTTFWSSFLPAVTNSLKANWRGSGVRSASGKFSQLLSTGWLWSQTIYSAFYTYYAY